MLTQVTPRIRLAAVAALFAIPVAAQSWSQAAPANNPGARIDAAMAYHAGTARCVLFGGSGNLNTTWLYNGADWVQAQPATVPPGRHSHQMVYDMIRDRVVMFGGQGSAGLLNDTWEWDGANWTQMIPASGVPNARAGHCMAHDFARGRTVMFGGVGNTNPNVPGTRTDTWEWDGTSWVQIMTATQPSEAEYGSMVYDWGRGVCVLTGGTSFFGAPDQSTWEWNGTTWTNRTAAVGPAPTSTPGLGVTYAGMVYMPMAGRVVHYGGRTPNGTFSTETFGYNGSAWSLIGSGSPSSRTRFAMCMDTARNVAVLYGGVTGNFQTQFTETWELSSGQIASYTHLGNGCAGPLGVPGNQASNLPRIGQVFQATITNVPAPESAIIGFGVSSTLSSFGPLPFDLAAYGAPGCMLRTSADLTVAVGGAGGSVSIAVPVPNQTALLGYTLHVQALVNTPGFNALGGVLSDAATGVVGL